MIEGRMNGVAEAHHAQAMFGFPYGMSAPYPSYGRQLPPDIKVTNPGYHGSYVSADHQIPMNLAQKDLPPHSNGYYPHRSVAAPPPSPFATFLSYPSLMGGPYTPNHQVHFTPTPTPHRPAYTTASSTPIIPISRPSAESSPIEVKTSSASASGENHDFKRPDENNSRLYKSKPRKRPVHVQTPAPIPVPTSIATTHVAPPIDRVPQQQPVQSPSQHLKSPLRPTLNVNAILSEIDTFCKDRLMYFGDDNMKADVSEDEYYLLRNRRKLIPIQDITLEDFREVTKNTENDLIAVTVKSIAEKRDSGTVLYGLAHPNQEEVGVLEVEAERPLFSLIGRCWKSYLPDRTKERCKGLHCDKISEGDVVLIMSPKDRDRKRASASSRIESIPPSKNRFQKATDLKKNHTNDSSYHEYNNNNNVSIAAAAATVAADRNAAKRPPFNENDSNNNSESAAATAKRKKSAEEANKRRYSDSYLEKKF
ncbi:uncharacterized protein LOC135848103 [Planococcus citri]|uniref:uncharacterized protein LOC135848103 n=1 Tax=Planococcus citri TaxID=170843 RepID=UPI0031F7C8EF